MSGPGGRRGAPSRSQAAFSWLLSPELDEPGAAGGRQAGHKGGKAKGKGPARCQGGGGESGAAASGSSYTPGFKLREEARGASAATSASLAELQASFEGVLEPEVVRDVLAASGGDAAAAMDALLAMAGGAESGSSPASQQQSGSVDFAAYAAAGAVAASTAVAGPSDQLSAAAQPCYWDTLPTECKWLVFEGLSLRDMARAAATSREVAAYVREQRRSLRTVVVPEGVSLTAVRGLVAAFPNAQGVSLWRCAPALRFQHEFEDMLAAVARGERDRSSGVPISQLSLARCGAATDGVVAAACETFSLLRRLDLSRCSGVGDAAMSRLAAYSRQRAEEEEGRGSGDGEWEVDWAEQQEEGEEGEGRGGEAVAVAGLGAMQLSSDSPSNGLASGPAAVAFAGTSTSTGSTSAREGANGSTSAAQPLQQPPGMESPESAVRRIAAQRHAEMMERSAAAARAQHGRPSACGLEEVCLRDTAVGHRGLRQLLQPGSATSKSLKVLDVSRCLNLGPDLDLQPRALVEVLRASGCTSLRCAVIQLPAEAPVRTLCLDGCRQLQEVTVVAPRLQSLNLSHSGQLRSLTLRCRRLKELRAVNCTNLSLAAGELLCPALEVLNLFGCRQLEAEGLEALAPCLTKCASLDLTGCISLPRLLLPEATALRSVSVSGCSLLRQVLLASPVLSRLRAAGCGRLMDVRLGTASLSQLDFENCGNLREVQLSGDVGGGSGSGWAAAQAAACEDENGGKPRRKALVLKGCTSLPSDAKAQLRAAVLGA